MQRDIPGGPGDQLLTLTEAQNFLRIGRSTLFELLKCGRIAYCRQGSRRYVWRSDLAAYVNESRVATDAA
ncbi:MAG TPA: helix-turn-helix domain-containing protein [Candidatus Cybelea sp.]